MSSPVQPPTFDAPAHVPAALIRDYPFIRGEWTDENPFETMLPRLHAEMPDIFYCPYAFPGRRPAWLLRRAADVRAVYQDTEHFSSKAFSRGELIGEKWSNVPSETDPPMHAKYRTVLNPLFSPRRMAALEDGVRTYARGYIADIKDRGACEFNQDFSFRFPIAVFLDLMGLPLDEIETFLAWEHDLLHEPDMAVITAATRTVSIYLRQQIDLRRKAPGDDFISFAVQTEIDGRKLNDDELVGLCFNLFIGGLDTVSTTLTHIFRHLAEHPAHQARLRADPAFIPAAAEELLRFYGAVTTFRNCVKPQTINGVTFMPGDKVAVSTTLANHDPAAYDRPHQVDLDRRAPSLTFAFGAHHCIGSNLARREIIVAMEEFLREIPQFAIAPGARVRTNLGSIIQIQALPLVWPA